jgi:hypothetical protein
LPPRNNATGEVTPTFHSGRPSLDGSLDENRFHLAKVVVVERWLLGRLRHSTFRSLAEVNAAIALLLTRLNEERPIGRLGVTRRNLLEEIDLTADKSVGEMPRELRLCAMPRPIYDRPPRRRRQGLRLYPPGSLLRLLPRCLLLRLTQ